MNLDATLDALCTLFDEELERQETVLAVVQRQSGAARARDVDALLATARALGALFQEGLAAERRRLALVETLVRGYALPVERQTLSALIETVPDPWQRRMREFQTRARAVMLETRRRARANRHLLRRALARVQGALAAAGVTGAGGAYDAHGGSAPALAPPCLDRAG